MVQTDKKENLLLNIVFNIVVPAVILSKFSSLEYLGPVKGLFVALSFPLIYGAYDLFKEKKVNYFSIIGLANTGLTGGFALMELDAFWFAVKEASVPALFGIIVLGSMKTSYPIVEKLLLNPAIVNRDLIDSSLQYREAEFKKLMFHSTMLVGLSFVVSSVLNFVLAAWLLQSPTGTEAFNAELGKMMALSFPVITIPSMIFLIGALVYLVQGIRKLTNLELSQILVGAQQNN